MSARLDNLFAPFEGTRDPRPIAIVRIMFFAGLAVHFAPSLLWLDLSYGRGAVRIDSWNHWLFSHLWRIPMPVLHVAAILTLVACLTAAAGWRTRPSAIVAGLGCYAFASFNSLHLQTLALIPAWAMLLLWAICGGGAAAFAPRATRTREPALLGGLILFQILLAVEFSGIEKLLAGWPGTNAMGTVLAYPKGFLVRDWVTALPVLHGSVVSTVLTWGTLVVELGAPIALLFRRTRLPALVLWELFFLGIVAMLEVPPLFWFIFAPVPLLALDDDQLARLSRVASPGRGRPSSSAPPAPDAP